MPSRVSNRRAAVLVAAAPLVCSLAVVPATDASTAATGAGRVAALAGLSEAQRVGQLVMVGAALDGSSRAATRRAVSVYHVGSVILTGRSDTGVSSVRTMTNRLQALATRSATGGVRLFVAADQEGGYVQTLSGPGFDTIPTALRQGLLAPRVLRHRAERWGSQLLAAGVDLDLAPVLDTVPPGRTSTNQPIGVYDREYGTDPSTVAAAGTAFIRGMHDAGVETTAKHFPGLGRVTGNTDTTFGVTDTETTRHDPYVGPFAAGVGRAGTGLVMVSLATYSRIDARHRAAFSSTVLHGMLRHDLGFSGVIVSDSMDATAVRDLTPGQRAVRFVRAGGDMVLTTHPADVPAMVSALLDRARSSATFRARVDASCRRVLAAKRRADLLRSG